MLLKHKIYYTIELKMDDDSYMFVCSYSTFNEAKARVEDLKMQTGLEYRILKIEKDVEEVS